MPIVFPTIFPFVFPTRQAAEAAATANNGHLLALLANDDWVEAEEADEHPNEVIGWGVSDQSGEQMLDSTDNTWVMVA